MIGRIKGHFNFQTIYWECTHSFCSQIGNPFSLLLLLFPILSYSQTLSGTSIVIAWSDSTIVIGADSKVTDTDDPTFSALTCKIIVIDDTTVFVHSGILADSGGFNIQSSFRRFMRSSGNVDQRLERFKDSVVRELTDIRLRDMERKREGSKMVKLLDQTVCVVIFISADSLRMKRIAFTATSTPSTPEGLFVYGRVYDPIRIDGSIQPTPFLMPLGYKEMTRSFQDSILSRNIVLSPVDFPRIVYSLITMEMILHPHEVGQPIDIIRLTRGKRPEWIRQEKEPCK